MVKICVFDTETTGLPPVLDGKDWNERNNNDKLLLNFDDLSESSSVWNKMLHSWPSIIQLSYIIYDTESPNNSKIFNKYIDIPDNIVIAETSIAIHHIDKEKIKALSTEKKALIHEALAEFINDIMQPDVVTIVGHNVQFDRKMIIAELLRLVHSDINMLNELKILMNNKNFVCTMDVTAPVCNIQIAVNYKDKKTGEDKVFYKLKSPKLIESYQYYFGYSLLHEALHDALVDVILCLRVFMKYNYNEDIYGKNEIITEFINKITIKQPEYNSDLDIENIKLEIIDIQPTNEIVIESTSKKTKRKNKKSKSKRFTHRKKQLLKKVVQNK
jgi:DNA polymerase III epsilon subunit-like protein